MAIFNIYGSFTVSAYTQVEAETREEALEEAKSRGPMSMPYLNPHQFDKREVWVVDEIDGEAQEIRIEE